MKHVCIKDFQNNMYKHLKSGEEFVVTRSGQPVLASINYAAAGLLNSSTYDPNMKTVTTSTMVADTCTHMGGHSFRNTPDDKFCSYCGEKNYDQK